MKILFATHAPWRPTGYGAPAMTVTRIWQTLGHQVFILAVDSGMGPGFLQYRGIHVAMPDNDLFGQDIIRRLCDYFAIDVVVSHFDPWVLRGDGYGHEATGRPWLAWTPIDQEPLARNLGEILWKADKVLALSRYGEDALRQAGIKRVMYVPLPIDTTLFAPGTPEEKARSRSMFGLDEQLVVGLAGSNSRGDRKALAEQIEGFCAFAVENGKERTKLLFMGEPYGEIPVPVLMGALGCLECLVAPDAFSYRYPLAERPAMAHFYRSCDVLLHATAAEGFGQCIVEAMASGVPVIYNATTSMPELAGPLGIPVTSQERVFSVHGGWWYRPQPEAVAGALLHYRWMKENGCLPTPEALRGAALAYSPEAVGMYWQDVLAEFEESRNAS